MHSMEVEWVKGAAWLPHKLLNPNAFIISAFESIADKGFTLQLCEITAAMPEVSSFFQVNKPNLKRCHKAFTKFYNWFYQLCQASS